MKLNIVLANPQIPQNTGNVARTCAATGANLHLIKPLGFELDDSKMKRSGLDYWDKLDVCVYEHFEDFFERTRGSGTCWFFETQPTKNYCDVRYENNAYLVFGREDTGIPEAILRANYDTAVRIPMRAGLRSLNMSNSVAVGVYEVLRQWNFPMLG
jgi:tRNA (cytidine/uridine-2'-O-)-methyltransferase